MHTTSNANVHLKIVTVHVFSIIDRNVTIISIHSKYTNGYFYTAIAIEELHFSAVTYMHFLREESHGYIDIF